MTTAMWIVSLLGVCFIFVLIYRIYADWLDDEDWPDDPMDDFKGPWR